MLLLGNLANEDFRLNSSEFYIHNKMIRSFRLENFWSTKLTEEKRKEFLKLVQDDFNSSGKMFRSTIAKEMPLSEWGKALEELESVQHEGKIILKCF